MTPILDSKNRQLLVRQDPLITAKIEETVLSADISAASSTLTVESIAGFAVNQILLVGELGSEDSEIVKTHASTAPSGSTITLAANTTFAHSRGAKVRRIKYNQVELSHSATAAGTKAVLATESLSADKNTHVYDETAQTSGFYFARFKENIGNTFSSYTDAVPYGGFDTNAVGHAVQWALSRNKTNFTDTVTPDFMYEEVNTCLKNIQGKQLRWDKHQQFNAVLGQTVRGTYYWNLSDLSTAIYEDGSNKSILAVRIGEYPNLEYKDPIEWEKDIIGDLKTTQVRTQASASDTTLEIDNSYDFDDTGSVNVYISGTKYNITYTGVTRSATAGVLTGVPASGTGSITVTIPVDTNVFQDEDEGRPVYFTVRNQRVETHPMSDGSYDNMNVYMDYWTVATEVDSLGDLLDTERFDMVKYWLEWKVRMMKEHDGKLNFKDGAYTLYKEALNDAIRNKGRGLKHKMKPKINKITYSKVDPNTRTT